MRHKAAVSCSVILMIAARVVTYAGEPVGGEFTYQGQLKDAGVPLNGSVDLLFEIFDAETAGDPVGPPLQINDVAVVKGLFSVELDFGAEVFGNQGVWLEVFVRSPHDPTDAEPFTPLSPRQPITAAPYALQVRGIFVDESGQVAIAKPTPDARLDVNGGIRSSRIDADHSIEIHGSSVVGGSLTLRSSISNKGSLSITSQILDDGGPPSGSSSILFRIGSPFGGVPIVMRITEEGYVGIGTTPPDPGVALHVTKPGEATSQSGGMIQMGVTDGLNVALDSNEIQARNNHSVSTLHLNRHGGDVALGGDVDVSGDAVFGGKIVANGGIDLGYEVVRKVEEDQSVVWVNCPPGKRVIGGGCSTGASDPVTSSFPLSAEPLVGEGWMCRFDQGLIGAADVIAYAICINVPEE